MESAALIYGTVQRWTTVVAIRMSSHLGCTIDANPRHRPAGRRRKILLVVGERQSTPRARAGLSEARFHAPMEGPRPRRHHRYSSRNRRSNVDAQKTTRVSRRQLVERVGRTRCECSSARTAIRLGAGQAGRTGDTAAPQRARFLIIAGERASASPYCFTVGPTTLAVCVMAHRSRDRLR